MNFVDKVITTISLTISSSYFIAILLLKDFSNLSLFKTFLIIFGQALVSIFISNLTFTILALLAGVAVTVYASFKKD